MLGDAMRPVVGKRMLEARAGGFLKTAAGTREGTNGGWNCGPGPGPGTGTGTGRGTGTDDFGSEQEEKVERLCGDGMG